MSLPHADLGATWAAARPEPAVVYLDHAACSRQSAAVLDAVAPDAAGRLELRAPALGGRWQPSGEPIAHRLGSSEAHTAGRVGLAVAVAEHLAAGPERVRERLAALGSRTAELRTDHAVLTTHPGPGRAPRDHLPPLLRVSPHLDTTDDDLAAAAGALEATTRAVT